MLRKTDSELFTDYLSDCSSLPMGCAEEIVFPQSLQEIRQVLTEFNSKKIKVTFSGAGTGVVGARIPLSGAVLATDNLNRIIDIKEYGKNGLKTAVVEPGVRLNELNAYLRTYGLKYLPDPTEKNAFLGGTIATNASGAQGFKFGQTRDHVLGLQVVLADGNVLDIQRGKYTLNKDLKIRLNDARDISCSLPDFRLPKSKNSAGYYVGPGTDLIDLFIGQEGTLGMVSLAEIKLVPLPEDVLSAMVYFGKEDDAVDFGAQLRDVSKRNRNAADCNVCIDAACIEFFDNNSLVLLRKKFSGIPESKTAAIYFEQDILGCGFDDILECYADFLTRAGISDNNIWIAQKQNDRDKMEKIRYDLPVLINEKVKANGFSKISTDIAVCDDNAKGMFEYYKSRLKGTRIPFCIFGHIGENHLHLNLMPETDDDFNKAKQMYTDFVKQALLYGGTISAEHGIGKLKREYFKLMAGEKALAGMAKIKSSFDPNLILCPGNIFAPELFDSL